VKRESIFCRTTKTMLSGENKNNRIEKERAVQGIL